MVFLSELNWSERIETQRKRSGIEAERDDNVDWKLNGVILEQ